MRAFVIALALVVLGMAPAQAAPRTWYVDTATKLQSVEKNSRPGDVIVVLPSLRPIDGGIALKPGQTLLGKGGAGLTNTTTRLDGDAVRLADNTTVRNLVVTGTRRGAIYGLDVTGVRVIGNDVSGHNTSCTQGFLIPEFNAPTNVPGVGITIGGGLPNGWAGIMIDGSSRQGGTAQVSGNVVHDAECGDGIDVRTWGTASYDVTIAGNSVHGLRQGSPHLKSVLAIGVQARDTSRLSAQIRDNEQYDLGNPDDLNLLVEGADSEGVFVNGVGPSQVSAVVTGNRYTNANGVGGFSANGLEAVTMGNGSRLSVVVRDSTFSGSPGDVIEEGALGTNGQLDMLVERVVAERSTGVGNTLVLPFNNGDCLLAGSLGAGNDVRLTVRDSVLRDCSNNGLSVGSNVVNGTGPTRSIVVDVDRTTITGNRGGNLGIRNFTPLDKLQVLVRRSNLAGSSSVGSSVADLAAETYAPIGSSFVDVGTSCLKGGLFAATVVGLRVVARENWWGQAGGPGLLRTLVLGGSLDTSAPLAAAPSYC